LLDQTDTARRTRLQVDGALLGQGFQVIFGGIGRSEAESAGDFRPRRRRAEHLDGVLDEVENFLLTWREFHGFAPRKIFDCIFVQ